MTAPGEIVAAGGTAAADEWVAIGLDNGGTTNNGTVLDASGNFLVATMAELPSLVREGPDKALGALADTVDKVLDIAGVRRSAVRAVGLDTPGPASAAGVLASIGATNFVHPAWGNFDIRGALEERLGIPVIYNNDANAAALYAHHVRYGREAAGHSSVAAIVGTGLGGGVVVNGQVVAGAAGMAGELGHFPIMLDGLLEDDQPAPSCNCGLAGDAESIASLTGIRRNLLPYWLTRFPEHELAGAPADVAAKAVRGYAVKGDPMALEIFRQQAMAIGRVFSVAAKFTDPDVYFVGGGVIDAAPHFRDWFLATVREHTTLVIEQERLEEVALVPHLDMAGARGSAIAAATWIRQAVQR
jgi:glucokinase